jgi:exopolysaccharide biosynthesis polyprenyl glycosylphosphotransferase
VSRSTSSERTTGHTPAPPGSPYSWADPEHLQASLARDAATAPPRDGRDAASKGRERSRTAARWLGVSEGPGPSKARTRRGMFARLLATADAIAAVGATFVFFLVGNQPLTPWELLMIPVIILLAKIAGLYDRDDVVIQRSTLDEAPQLFELATLTALGGWLVQAGLSEAHLRATSILAGWLALFVLLVTLRYFARELARRLAPAERVLFVGDPEAYQRLRFKLVPENRLGILLLGWVPFRAGDAENGAEEPLGEPADLPAIIARNDVHRVVVEGESDHREMLDVVRLSKLLGLQVSLLPALLDVVGSSVQFEDVHGLRLMGIRSFGLSWSSRFVKRSLDVVGASIGLFLLSPLFLTVGAAIKLGSPGPVFFCQERVGRNGRRFGMVKFRSMVDGADALKDELRHLNEAEGLFKIADDPRITRVGRWLRRTSVDELPQLINVLRGEMSLVGPRPLVLDDDERIQGWHRQRLHLTPGMTGPWQVLGGSSRIPLDEMVKIDYLYVANWSLWNDLKIMLRTVPVVFGFRGQ